MQTAKRNRAEVRREDYYAIARLPMTRGGWSCCVVPRREYPRSSWRPPALFLINEGHMTHIIDCHTQQKSEKPWKLMDNPTSELWSVVVVLLEKRLANRFSNNTTR
jgi:hypothetical protein